MIIRSHTEPDFSGRIPLDDRMDDLLASANSRLGVWLARAEDRARNGGLAPNWDGDCFTGGVTDWGPGLTSSSEEAEYLERAKRSRDNLSLHLHFSPKDIERINRTFEGFRRDIADALVRAKPAFEEFHRRAIEITNGAYGFEAFKPKETK